MRIKQVEKPEDVIWYFASVLSPMSYFDLVMDPSEEQLAETAEHTLVAGGLLTLAATIPWALSGGGASMGMWFGSLPPTAKRVAAIKIDAWASMARWMYHHRAAFIRAGLYGLGSYVLYTGFRNRYSTISYTGSGGTVFHPGGGISFRNPISGM